MNSNIFRVLIFFYRPILLFFKQKANNNIRMSKPLGPKNMQYNIIKILGQGAFAVVYEALDDQNNKVAIKAIKMSQLNRTRKLKQLVKTQISVLKGCNNENVIKYVDSFETGEFLYIVTQFCNGGDLQTYLKKQTVLEDQAVEFLKQILNGFKGLHEVGAMHRDFKAANILIHEGVCKIADLGFAKQMQQNSIAKTVLGTSITMAPEVLEETPYGFQADIWSIGVVFYQMLYKKYPYDGKNNFELIRNIKKTKPKYEDINLSKEALDFLQKCLTVNPKNRINWKQIYDHPLITKNQGRIYSSSILRSQFKLKQNKQFYENIKFPQTDNIQQRIASAKTIKIKILDKENFRMSKISEALRREEQIKSQEEAAILKFDMLFLERRNDLMFFQKFLHPYLSNLEHLKINHSIASFVMSKKSCIELKKIQESIQKSVNPFLKQKGFEIYSKTENFQKIKNLLRQDRQRIQKICDSYKRNIKISSLQIQSQFFDLTKSKNPSYESLMNQIIKQYLRLLYQSACFVKVQSKSDFIRVTEALKYYHNTYKPHTYEFDRIIMTANFAQIEKNFLKKSTYN